jgi:hypothetical protein
MNYSEIISNPFAYWPNYGIPRLPVIAQELLEPITDYDNMLLAGTPEYNHKAHEVLINAFLFYMGVQ